MKRLFVEDVKVGDVVDYQDPRLGQVKVHVEDIKYEAGIPTVVLGTETETFVIKCRWSIPGVSSPYEDDGRKNPKSL